MDLAKKKILLTGGTSGLGLEVAKLLLLKGAEVWAMGRSLKDTDSENPGYRFIRTDFAEMDQLIVSLKDLLKDDVRFDLIINNAGVLSPADYNETKDGFEYTFQVNYLSHLVINEAVMKCGAYNDPLMILAVTSPVYNHIRPDFKIPGKTGYRSFRVYSESKYYMLLIGDILKREFPESKFGFYGFNPGTFGSGIYRMQKPWFHVMYKIAAPFMRRSASVAGSLVRVAEREENSYNGIYTRNRIKPSFVPAHSDAAEEFITSCSEIVKAITIPL
jgi:NAD(P)-dependent dehydrogenase (short-subunit alcohol dehydrogenase family)